MVAQSDWLPMMIATGGDTIVDPGKRGRLQAVRARGKARPEDVHRHQAMMSGVSASSMWKIRSRSVSLRFFRRWIWS